MGGDGVSRVISRKLAGRPAEEAAELPNFGGAGAFHLPTTESGGIT